MKFKIIRIYVVMLVSILILIPISFNCTSSQNNSLGTDKYIVKNIEPLAFSDYVLFELQNVTKDSIKYAITYRINDKKHLDINYKKIVSGRSYGFVLNRLDSPFIMKARTISFYTDISGFRIWENDTMKTQLYYIENALDSYLLK